MVMITMMHMTMAMSVVTLVAEASHTRCVKSGQERRGRSLVGHPAEKLGSGPSSPNVLRPSRSNERQTELVIALDADLLQSPARNAPPLRRCSG